MAKLLKYLWMSATLTAAALAQVPDPTLPPSAQSVVFTVRGAGAQIYRCEAPGWVFRAPVARLFDPQGREVGTHGDGPSWTYQDSSSVEGVLMATTPSGDNSSIPSLLLQAVNPRRTGVLTTIEYIRRSDTHGGQAPTAGCDAVHIGDLIRVPYTATYTFYSSKASH